MNRRQRHIVAVVHVVRIRTQRDLIEIISQRRAGIQAAVFVHRIDKFVDIRPLVDAFVALVRIRRAHARIVHNPTHQLVYGNVLTVHDPALYLLRKRRQFLLRARGKAHGIRV